MALDPKSRRILRLSARLVAGLTALGAIPLSLGLAVAAVPGTPGTELTVLFWAYLVVSPAILALGALGCLLPVRALHLPGLVLTGLGLAAIVAPFVWFGLAAAASAGATP